MIRYIKTVNTLIDNGYDLTAALTCVIRAFGLTKDQAIKLRETFKSGEHYAN
jgi:hypothetical protein